ncbi:hypothetical protein Erwinia_phage_Aioli_00035 [Erwinia phage Aioli]|nr:hypothetical protein Erwinia_phage_Aioli_00035 [Erwinia phage Aioli]
MNNLNHTSTGLVGGDFIKFLKYLFDDTFEIDATPGKHSSSNVTLGVEVTLEVAIDMVDEFQLPIAAADLVGTWAMDASSDYSWGIEWSMVDCAYRVEQVTETKIVTSWKPVQDAKPATKESVPAQPASKK